MTEQTKELRGFDVVKEVLSTTLKEIEAAEAEGAVKDEHKAYSAALKRLVPIVVESEACFAALCAIVSTVAAYQPQLIETVAISAAMVQRNLAARAAQEQLLEKAFKNAPEC
jgi:hypothetical protein